MEWQCKKCGSCCKILGSIKHDPMLKDFPYKAKENGECEMLEGDKCGVYEIRPNECRSDYMYEKYYKKLLTKEAHQKMMIKCCKRLKKTTDEIIKNI